jgi:uncharacterized protein YjbJ (UPF0337 family)
MENKMNKDTLSAKWKEIVGSIKETWGDLTDQDLERVKGNKDKLVALIQEKYGETKETIEKKINQWLDML